MAERKVWLSEKYVRRTGSASRRVAARSGLLWDPGLPRSDAFLSVQATVQSPGAKRCD